MRWWRWWHSFVSKKRNSWIYFGILLKRQFQRWQPACVSVSIEYGSRPFVCGLQIQRIEKFTTEWILRVINIKFDFGSNFSQAKNSNIFDDGQTDEHWSGIRRVRVQNKFINSCTITTFITQVNRLHCFLFSPDSDKRIRTNLENIQQQQQG